MNRPTTSLHTALAWLVTILTPLALLILAVRLVMTPAFLQIEYRTPGFPPDPYGFTLEDRLRWAGVALEVLVDQKDVAFVEALSFDDGTPMYNARELRHWGDVFRLWRWASRLGYGSWVVMGLLALWAWQAGWGAAFRWGLGRGGLLTAMLMGAVLLFAILAFGLIFVGFHQLLFPPGTWTFFYSDTFIRLFPERFWRDIFLVIGAIAGGAGLGLWYFLLRRPSRA